MNIIMILLVAAIIQITLNSIALVSKFVITTATILLSVTMIVALFAMGLYYMVIHLI